MYQEQVVLEGFDEQIRKLEDFDRIAAKHSRFAMQQSVVTVSSTIKPLTPVYRGELRRSIAGEVKQIGSRIEGHIGSSLSDEVYPKVMELGRKPGTRPPIAPLIRWVHLQLGVPNSRAAKVAAKVAFVIGKKGIKGKLFFKRGWEQSKSKVLAYFNTAGQKIVKDLAVD